jgi:hypothetical protein
MGCHQGKARPIMSLEKVIGVGIKQSCPLANPLNESLVPSYTGWR